MESGTKTGKHDFFIICSLIVLSLVPAVAGVFRLITLSGGVTIDAENARFHASPVPVSVHIVCSLLYCILGAFQLAPGYRKSHLSWHRKSGRWIAMAGLAAAISGLWMTQFYPPAKIDGPSLYYIRLVVAPAMILCLGLGIYAIVRGDRIRHGAWMLRSYALGMGAGTQVFTHIGWTLLFSPPAGLSRDIAMALGWLINIAAAEWVIWRARERRNAAAAYILNPALRNS